MFAAYRGLARQAIDTGIHARLDDLEGDFAGDWFRLLRHKHDAEATFSDLFAKFVRPDQHVGFFGDGPGP